MTGTRTSVRVPLILGIVAVVTVLIAGLVPAISSYSTQREEAVTTAQNAIVAAGDASRERIRNFLTERSTALACFSADPTLDTEIGHIIDPPAPAETKNKSSSSDDEEEEEESPEEIYAKAMEAAREKVRTRMKTFCDGHKTCKRVLASNETNNIIVSTNERDKGGSFTGTLIHSALESPVPVVLMSSALEEMLEANAVVAARSSSKQYAIVAAFDTAELFKGLNKLKASLGGSARILVVDNRRMALLGGLESQKGKSVEIDPVTTALKGESGFKRTADEEDQLVLAAFRTIGEAGVATVALRRMDDVQSGSASFPIGGIFGALGIGLIGAVIIFFVGRRSFESLSLLHQASQRISTGDLNERVPVLSDDEVGDISRAFNDILAQLQDARGGGPPPKPRGGEGPLDEGGPPVGGGPPLGGGPPPESFPF